MASQDLAGRVRSLSEAVELCDGRVDEDVLAAARAVASHVDQRMAFTGDHTVVALAGATGSGKSSTFNALSGTELAEPGVRRPTTSRTMAATWGEDPPSDLLDWLEVPRRHVVSDGGADFAGLVLLDLPDHDSTEQSHRDEVDRLVKQVDLMVWVVDPQKYADAALHDRYLKPLASHADVMVVVLNQIDKLTPLQLKACVVDLRRLLDSEGLGAVQIETMSAVTGAGVPELRRTLAGMVKAKKAAGARVAADISKVATKLASQVGSTAGADVDSGAVRDLNRALANAAGAEVVGDAVLAATRHRGVLATGWPALKWVAALRPDPLRRLHLDKFSTKKRKEIEPGRVQRTSLRTGSGVAKARVDSAIRDLCDGVTEGMPRGWADAVRTASRSSENTLPDDLDHAMATADLAMDRGFGYWRIFQVLQWILIGAVIAGLLWLAADFVLAYFQLPPLPGYPYRGIPTPTWLVGGGVLAGLLLALISRLFVEFSARAKTRRARRVLTRAVADVAQAEVLDPIEVELERYRSARKAIARAL